jgi:hypothetical protein
MKAPMRRHATAALRLALGAILVLAVAVSLAGCRTTAKESASTGAAEGNASSSSAAKKVDYASLLTQDDVRTLTGRSDVVLTQPGGNLQNNAAYLAVFEAPEFPKGLWLRVGAAGMFGEAKRASAGTTKEVPGVGDEAFSWVDKGFDSGIAILKDGNTYLISTRWRYDKPQVSDEQMMQIAKTIAGRL